MRFRQPARPALLWAALLLLLLTACTGEAAATPPLRTVAAGVASPAARRASASPSPTSASAAATQPLAAAPTRLPPSPTVFVLPSATPTPTRPAVTPAPSATPDCSDSLRYLQDLTVPDGTVVSPGAVFDKRWRVENNGACNWDGRYRLRLINGPALGAPEEQALYPARAGGVADVRMLLAAPGEPGTYRSAWQAINPVGLPFGDPIFVEIIVAAQTAP